jgi:hypothetical protein
MPTTRHTKGLIVNSLPIADFAIMRLGKHDSQSGESGAESVNSSVSSTKCPLTELQDFLIISLRGNFASGQISRTGFRITLMDCLCLHEGDGRISTTRNYSNGFVDGDLSEDWFPEIFLKELKSKREADWILRRDTAQM